MTLTNVKKIEFTQKCVKTLCLWVQSVTNASYDKKEDLDIIFDIEPRYGNEYE
jgi:hypothetical protein